MVNANPNYKIYVVEDTNTKNVIANTTLLLERKFIHGGKYVAHIEDVVVDSSARGHGVGEALNQAALAEARSSGAVTVDLTSRPSREAANRLYQRLGFVQRDTNVYRYSL